MRGEAMRSRAGDREPVSGDAVTVRRSSPRGSEPRAPADRLASRSRDLPVRMAGAGAAALEAVAGNRAVSSLLGGLRLQRDEGGAAPPAAPPKPRHTWVFIMGADPPGTKNRFFTEAEAFYRAKHGSVANSHLEQARTLEAVLSTVNASGDPVGLLIIVSHGHPDGRLMFDLGVTPDAPPHVGLPVTRSGGTPTQFDTAQAAVKQGKLTTVSADVIDDATKIVIKGCNIGRSQRMVATLHSAFGGRAALTTTTHAQFFGGGAERLAEYFVERPGKATLARKALAGEFATKYGTHVANSDAKFWSGVAAQAKRTVDAVAFEAFRGPVPAPNDKAFKAGFPEQLKQIADQGGTSIAFVKRERTGADFVYHFAFKKLQDDGSAVVIPATISTAAPPDDAAAIAEAKAASGRPDAAEFTVRRSVEAGDTVVTVDAVRTEWKVVHTVIRDKSGAPIPPPADTDVFWFTTQPAVPPTP